MHLERLEVPVPILRPEGCANGKIFGTGGRRKDRDSRPGRTHDGHLDKRLLDGLEQLVIVVCEVVKSAVVRSVRIVPFRHMVPGSISVEGSLQEEIARHGQTDGKGVDISYFVTILQIGAGIVFIEIVSHIIQIIRSRTRIHVLLRCVQTPAPVFIPVLLHGSGQIVRIHGRKTIRDEDHKILLTPQLNGTLIIAEVIPRIFHGLRQGSVSAGPLVVHLLADRLYIGADRCDQATSPVLIEPHHTKPDVTRVSDHLLDDRLGGQDAGQAVLVLIKEPSDLLPLSRCGTIEYPVEIIVVVSRILAR